jgi:hypothetical protein
LFELTLLCKLLSKGVPGENDTSFRFFSLLSSESGSDDEDVQFSADE